MTMARHFHANSTTRLEPSNATCDEFMLRERDSGRDRQKEENLDAHSTRSSQAHQRKQSRPKMKYCQIDVLIELREPDREHPVGYFEVLGRGEVGDPADRGTNDDSAGEQLEHNIEGAHRGASNKCQRRAAQNSWVQMRANAVTAAKLINTSAMSRAALPTPAMGSAAQVALRST